MGLTQNFVYPLCILALLVFMFTAGITCCLEYVSLFTITSKYLQYKTQVTLFNKIKL